LVFRSKLEIYVSNDLGLSSLNTSGNHDKAEIVESDDKYQ